MTCRPTNNPRLLISAEGQTNSEPTPESTDNLFIGSQTAGSLAYGPVHLGKKKKSPATVIRDFSIDPRGKRVSTILPRPR